MSLSSIKDKLYKKEADPNLARHDESEFDPHFSSRAPSENPTAPDLWAAKQTGLEQEEKTAIKKGAYVLGAIVFILFLVVVGVFIKRALFHSDKVTVAIAGPQDARSGKLLTYEINYENNNRIGLKNAVLKVSFPESFKPEDVVNWKEDSLTSGTIALGDIPSGKKGKVIFNGRTYNPTGALIYLKAEMKYQPGSFSTEYLAENQLGINVVSSPLSIEIVAPQNVSTGDEVNYLVTYRNNGTEDMEGLRIRADYPEGFSFSVSEPKVSEGNNIWYIGTLAGSQDGKIVINGKLEGERDQVKTVRVTIGAISNDSFISYNDEETKTTLVSSPLLISQSVNGVVKLNANAGDTLRYSISYKNNGNIGLKDLIVTEKIDSAVLDYSSLNTNGGHFDETTKTITWKASDHPGLKNLEPGQSGSIDFLVRVKNVIPMESERDKNFVISALAKIDSPDIPTPIHMNKIIAGNKIDLKLNSKLVLAVSGYYNDQTISNSGPIPPKVGEETTYTMHWVLRNVSNDVSGAKVETVLPTGVFWTEKFVSEDAKFSYNERTNSLVWDIGNISAGKGILNNPLEVSFQVKIKPSSNQVGKDVELLGASTYSAKDLFTGDNLSASVEGKTTKLLEDSGIGYNYNVVE